MNKPKKKEDNSTSIPGRLSGMEADYKLGYDSCINDLNDWLPDEKEIREMISKDCSKVNMKWCIKNNNNTPFIESIAETIAERLK